MGAPKSSRPKTRCKIGLISVNDPAHQLFAAVVKQRLAHYGFEVTDEVGASCVDVIQVEVGDGPTVTITSPADGAEISGPTTAVLTAPDGYGITYATLIARIDDNTGNTFGKMVEFLFYDQDGRKLGKTVEVSVRSPTISSATVSGVPPTAGSF